MTEPVRILLVDDENDFLQALGSLIRGLYPSAVVDVADSGQQALALLNQREVDCVVSDFNMPGMNGVVFLRAVELGWPSVARVLLSNDIEVLLEAKNEAKEDLVLSKLDDAVNVVRQIMVAAQAARSP